ncbi:MAG: hypothetical protein A3K19_16055 [Lentisphaerae bacterium RIFOXYB12_FULL_65_16]|nr:MAG: hypothetical protein A3K18_12970 [Lentisphaerae bacterium RIFOXYA12_64_32]OGV87339.1 MAG: hypothetical protein A3K19_16055 [Lentisphaerae bacterium RIFOXYB12_FULL_65_16]
MQKSMVVYRWVAAVSVGLNLAFGGGLLRDYWVRTRTPALTSATYAEENGTGHFVLRFSTPMSRDPAEDAYLRPFMFTPVFQYDVAWDDPCQAVVIPRSALPPGKTYLVKPRSGLRDLAGKALAETPCSVTAGELRVEGIGAPQMLDSTRIRLSFKFNGLVSPIELVSVMTVTDRKGHALEVKPVETRAVLCPAVDVRVGEGVDVIAVAINPGLKAACAELGLRREYRAEFPIGTHLVIGELGAGSGSDGIYLSFSASGPLLLEGATTQISIVPKAEFRVQRAYWGEHYRIEGDLAPNTFYKVTFHKGFRTQDGRVLEEDAARTVCTPNLSPILCFVTEGPFFPRNRDAVLPLRLCNVAEVELEATRIYPNNLVSFMRCEECSADAEGPPVGTTVFQPNLAANTIAVRQVALGELLRKAPFGVYQVTAGAVDRSWFRSSRTFVWTDLGLSAIRSPNGFLVWVTGLGDGRSVAGCEVEVLSYRNQRLGQGSTDADGLTRLELTRTFGDDESPFLIVARKGADTALLPLDSSYEHDLAAFDMPPRPFPDTAYEAYLYTERGICRPGESICLSALVRDRNLDAAGGFPGEIQITDPEGKVFHKMRLAVSELGFASAAVPVPVDARTGIYNVALGVPGNDARSADVWGRCSFRVGHYTPDRLRAGLTLNKDPCSPGETVTADLSAAYYFGRPAAESRAVFRTLFGEAEFAPSGYREFAFGNPERALNVPAAARIVLTTDAAGKRSYEIALPAAVTAPAAVRLTVVATVDEPGGRGVSATAGTTLHPCAYYLGLKPLGDSARPPEKRLSFAWIALDPAAHPARPGGPLRYELFQDVWRYVLTENQERNYFYQWTKERIAAGKGEVPVSGNQPRGAFDIVCDQPGSYVLRVTDASSTVQTLLCFEHGEGDGARTRLTTPSFLVMTPDRNLYRAGDSATLRFKAPGRGHALVCTATDQVCDAGLRPVEAGENTVTVPLPQCSFGSVYVAVTLVLEPGNPPPPCRRLFGLIRLDVDRTDRALVVKLDAPAMAQPGQTVPVALNLSQNGQPVPGQVQLLAVDEGILALTDHPTPDPLQHFFGARRCTLGFNDMYDHLFPELPEQVGQESAPGGDAAATFRTPVNPAQMRPAIVVLPPVDVPAEGVAQVALPLPEHTGALRLMAVAYNRSGAGNAALGMQLRNPLSILLTAPRAVAPGDEFEVTAQVVNNDFATDAVVLEVSGDGPIRLPTSSARKLSVPKGQETVVVFRVNAAAAEAGPAVLTARVRGADGAVVHEARATLAVRPASPPVYVCGTQAVAPNGECNFKLRGGWLSGTGVASLRVSTSMATEAAGALSWLRAYPYGCLEQTVSAAFPLLYLSEIQPAKSTDDALGAADVEPETRKAVQRLALMELPSGGFAMWPGGSVAWQSGSVYAAHFLIEARQCGVAIDDGLWGRTRDFLESTVSRRRRDSPAEDRAYALYLLSCAERPAAPLAEALAQDADASRFSRFLAAAALVRGGRAKRGMELLADIRKSDVLQGDCKWDMDSRTRRAGLAAMVQLDTAPDAPEALELIDILRRERTQEGHWGSTQNNALAVLALAKWSRLHAADAATRGAVVAPDGRTCEITRDHPVTFRSAPTDQAFAVRNSGPGTLYLSWESRGVPLELPDTAVEQGLSIQRSYCNEDGEERAAFARGDLVQVRIAIRTDQWRNNVVIADLLPGGFEIEDDNLRSRWAEADDVEGATVNFVEKLDDRLLLFCNLRDPGHASFTYHVRAVTRGTFAVPGVAAEAMYEPHIRACTAGKKELEIR